MYEDTGAVWQREWCFSKWPEYRWRLLMDTMNIRYTSPYMYNNPSFLYCMFYMYATMASRICMKTQVQSGKEGMVPH